MNSMPIYDCISIHRLDDCCAICYVHVILQSQKTCDMHLIYNIFSKLGYWQEI